MNDGDDRRGAITGQEMSEGSCRVSQVYESTPAYPKLFISYNSSSWEVMKIIGLSKLVLVAFAADG